MQIPIICFMMFEAEKFEDFAEALTDIITTNIAFASYLCLLNEILNLVQLIDDLNALVKTSEF